MIKQPLKRVPLLEQTLQLYVVVIGNYSFIGAGSIITKNVPNYALVVGNPGKIIGWVGESGERLIIDNEIGKDPILDQKFKLNYVNGEIESVEKI